MSVSRVLAVALVATLVAGCNTEEELLKQKLKVLEAEETALKELQAELRTRPELEGPGAVALFFSKDVINAILAGAHGVVVPVPNLDGGELVVTSLRTDFRTGFPLVLVQAVARKKGLDATLELEGVARIQPTIEGDIPRKLRLSVHVDSLVPNAKWGIFEFKIRGFVRDLLQVKFSESVRTAGVIEIPIETAVDLKLPAKSTPVSFQGVHATVHTPELSLMGTVTVTRIITLPDGIHVYGKVEASEAL